jgi:hypothetical protein
MNRRSRTSQIEDSFYFQVERECHVMADKLKIRILEMVLYIGFLPCVKVVKTNNFMT